MFKWRKERKKRYVIFKRKKHRNKNPNLPAQVMADSCLLMDDMLFLLTCLHKLRTRENSTSLYRSQHCGCVRPYDVLNPSEL